jgi:hypothetical protein
VTTRADQIRTRQSEIRTNLDALEALEEPTDDDHLRTDALLQEWDELSTELAPIAEREQRIAEVRRAMAADAANAEAGANMALPRQGGDGNGPVVRNKRDPFSDLESVRNGITPASEVRSRALDAVEMYASRSDHWGLQHDGAEQATRLVEKGGKAFGTAVARQMLTTGSPEYLAAFELLERPGRLRLPRGAVPDARERRVPGAVHPGPDDHPHERRLREPVPAVREREDDRHERLERRHRRRVSVRSGPVKVRRPRTRPRPSAS